MVTFIGWLHIYYPSSCQLLKLCIVNVGTVQGQDISTVIYRWHKHKTVVGGSRSEADIRWHGFIGMYVDMHLYTSLLLPAIGMPACTLEY